VEYPFDEAIIRANEMHRQEGDTLRVQPQPLSMIIDNDGVMRLLLRVRRGDEPALEDLHILVPPDTYARIMELAGKSLANPDQTPES
jgi:hypothetical protein